MAEQDLDRREVAEKFLDRREMAEKFLDRREMAEKFGSPWGGRNLFNNRSWYTIKKRR